MHGGDFVSKVLVLAPRYAGTAGTGHYLPKMRMTNEEASKKLGVQLDPWPSTARGTTARDPSAPGEATSDLAAAACREAPDRAQLTVDDVDMVIPATDAPDFISPPTACAIHKKLGMKKHTGAFHINAACARDYTPTLQRIGVPVPLVAGDLDLTPPEATKFLQKPIPNAQLAVARGVGHLPDREDPEEFDRVPLRFLKVVAYTWIRSSSKTFTPE